jgi:hypothetical protein
MYPYGNPSIFRDMYFAVRSSAQVYKEVLKPFINSVSYQLDTLTEFSKPEAIERKEGKGDTVDLAVSYALEELYALSRISDLLLLPFQPGSRKDWFTEKQLSLGERELFLRQIGLRRIETRSFHPFYHEVVGVEQSLNPNEPISITEEVWAGYMFGNLMFCRAGVNVRGGADHIVKSIAEASTIYFTFVRNNRPASDLSHGWGHNSQWSTSFRRDYEHEGRYYYNVDGDCDLTASDLTGAPCEQEDQLEQPERVELLTHRCFIRTPKPHNDLWPNYDVYVE